MKKLPITRVHAGAKKMTIVANWKMNPQTLQAARAIIASGKKAIGGSRNTQLIICPPAPYLGVLARRSTSNIFFGAQNVHHEAEGAYTGEHTARQVGEVRGKYVIVGHAERRVAGETDTEVSKKMLEVTLAHLVPILCIGEKARDEKGDYLQVLKDQVVRAYALVPQTLRSKTMIAYEPVYAIGASKPPSEHEIHQTILYIKKILIETYGGSVARAVPILYGGAVDETTVREIVKGIPECSGVLVGRASTNPVQLYALLTALQK